MPDHSISCRLKQSQHVRVIFFHDINFHEADVCNLSYMYGGRDSSSHYFDDIWILSLPSFTWTQVYNGQNPRFAHTCHLVGNRTLLTVGGIASLTQKSGQPDANAPPCDWEIKGVGVMDLTTIVWGSVYDSQAPAYEVPAKLLATIGGE